MGSFVPLQAGHLNQQLELELFDSLEKISSAIQSSASKIKGEGARPSALVYAAYYDLAVATQRLLAAQKGSKGSEDLAPRVTTLSPDFYSADEIETIIRWLDIEPENAMGLVAVSTEVLESARGRIFQALQALEIGCPQAYQEFVSITREIVLADSGPKSCLSFRGASSFALWGALAINPQAHQNWWEYLATLVHESAHSVLFAISRSGPLVLNEPEARYFSPLRQEERPMDGIYHAAFVSAREAWVLNACLSAQAFVEPALLNEQVIAELHRVKEQSLASFGDCLAVIAEHGKLTEMGKNILKDCQASLA